MLLVYLLYLMNIVTLYDWYSVTVFITLFIVLLNFIHFFLPKYCF